MESKKLDEFTNDDLTKIRLVKKFFPKAKIEVQVEVAPYLAASIKWIDELEGRIEYIIKKQQKEKFVAQDIVKPVDQPEKRKTRKKA